MRRVCIVADDQSELRRGGYTDPAGNYWQADTNPGPSNVTFANIANTNAQPLYQDERWSSTPLAYSFGAAPGTYIVILKFAEIQGDSNRRFNVSINGQQVLSTFSKLASALSFNTAVDQRFVTNAVSNQISITLTPVVGAATISAIEIVPDISFADVQPSQAFYPSVHFMRETGVTLGCTSAAFCPGDNITRGQMAVFIVRGLFWALKRTPDNFTFSSQPYFTDVPTSHIFFPYIQKLKELNITAGCEDGTKFCPDHSVSWGQLSVFAVRSWEYRTSGAITNNFCPGAPAPTCIPNTNPRLDVLTQPTPVYFPNDVSPQHIFFQYVQKIVNLAIVDRGCAAGTYCVDYPITRGDAAILISRGVMGVYNPPSPNLIGITPTSLEINLGAIPFDRYYDSAGSVAFTGCRGSSITVQNCIKQSFSNDSANPSFRPDNYVTQGVTGVRFFFGLGGGYYSTPFRSDRSVDEADWILKYRQFLRDLRAAGVQRITPSPVFTSGWSGTPATCDGCFYFQQQSNATTCGISTDLHFLPWVPFGYRLINNEWHIDMQDFNDAYNCAAGNPYFWGWGPFFQLFNRILQVSYEEGMIVSEWDMENEINMTDFTVTARLLYDNKHGGGVDVLGILRLYMAINGFTDRNVTFSTALDRPLLAAFNCGSAYFDSAMFLAQSALNAAIAGPTPMGGFGVPAGFNLIYGLACGGSKSGMAYVPVSHNQPYVTDVHTHVCVAGDGNGNGGKECQAIEDCNIANGTNCQRFDATATATTVFNSLKDMMVKYGGIFPILGESNSNQRCDDHTPSIAKQVVDGYRASTLRSTYGSTTTFRPWNYPADAKNCYKSPVFLNPPYNVFFQ